MFTATYVGATVSRPTDTGEDSYDSFTLEYYTELQFAAEDGGSVPLKIFYDTALSLADVEWNFNSVFYNLTNPGFPCLSRKLRIVPAVPTRYVAPGRTLRFVFPFLGIQVMLQ